MRRRLLAVLIVLYATLMAVLVFAPQVLAQRNPSATCTGTLAHATTTAITVPSGAVCRVSGSTVNGSVTVQRDAYFEAWDTRISGTVRASGALTVFVHDGASVGGSVLVNGTSQFFLYRTSVNGMVKLTNAMALGFGHVQVCDTAAGGIEIRGSGPDVLIGDPEAACPGNRVKNDIAVVSNDTVSQLDVSGNVITGSLLVTDNRGSSPKQVMNNTVRGRTNLSNNAAPFASSSSVGAA